MKGFAFVVLLLVQNEKGMFLVELSYGFYLKKRKEKRHESFFPPLSLQSHFNQKDDLQILQCLSV